MLSRGQRRTPAPTLCFVRLRIANRAAEIETRAVPGSRCGIARRSGGAIGLRYSRL
jgi:hypothetical protein